MTDLTLFKDKFPMVASRGIDEPTWLTLKGSLYPGAADESIIMVIDYCKSRGLDPMMKPVHIVPMSVKGLDGQYSMRDVIMPGINTYRVMASRSGDLAGTATPIFGPQITSKLGNANFTYPEYCEVTVSKIIGKNIVDFTAREYFVENYASKSRNDAKPNSMWTKRPRGQLAKCAEAQALRKGWPEIGQQPTYEEMAGKSIERDITPVMTEKTSLITEAAKTPDRQTIFDEACLKIESANHPGELQEAFGEGWQLLKAIPAGPEMKSLQEIYEEKKAMFEKLEKDNE